MFDVSKSQANILNLSISSSIQLLISHTYNSTWLSKKQKHTLDSHNFIETDYRHKHIEKIKIIDIKTQDRHNENMSIETTKTQDKHIKNISTEDTMIKDIIGTEALKT